MTLALCGTIFSASAIKPQDIKVYVNPGHGGHDSDDRNVVIAPYKQGDPEGFWESNSNLDKGLYLRDMLAAKGFQVAISRVTNTSDDDLPLSTIGRLANNFGADIFLSIHSNATGTTARRNAPLILYRGYTGQPVYPKSTDFAQVVNKQLLDNQATVWTSTNMNMCGDWTFYPNWGDKVGLGVLRNLALPGVLSEGSFHDYIPETYRLMNMDFKWLEAWHFLKAIEELFGVESNENTGVICGSIYDERALRNVSYVCFDRDRLEPMNNAKVQLVDKTTDAVIKEYTTDNLQNGFYLFKELAPGEYVIKVQAEGHYDATATAGVTANKISYANIPMTKIRTTAPEVVDYSPVWKDGDPLVVCNATIKLHFNWDMDQASTEAAFSITPALPGKFVWSDGNYRLEYVPTESMETNTVYTVKLAKSAQHMGGMSMKSDFEMSFRTDDRNYMSLISMWPFDNAEMDINNPYVMINVDSPLSMTTINQQLQAYDSEGKKLNWNVRARKAGTYDEPYGWVRIPISSPLKAGEEYKFVVSKGVQDKKGITLDQEYTAKFKVRDFSEPLTEGTKVLDFEDAAKFSVDEERSSQCSATLSLVKGVEGSSALNVKYVFTAAEGGSLYIDVPNDVHAYTSKDAVSINIYGDLSGNRVSAVFESEGDIRQVQLSEIDYYAWQLLKADLTKALPEGKSYSLVGIVIEQLNNKQGQSGEISLDQFVIYPNMSGVDEVRLAGITVYPNPASEYLIANADALIEELQLYSSNGAMVAKVRGNVMNVSEIPAGNYVVKVALKGMSETRKVVISH